MTGMLIGIVGPSGVGKDSLMQAMADADPGLDLVRRVITRDAGLGGEDFDPVTEAQFRQMQQDGAFCVDWQAHGLFYGIPRDVQKSVANGQTLLVNLSRSVLGEVARRFEPFVVLQVTAKPETLAARLTERGRETAEEIRRRLARPPPFLDTDAQVLTISNDGPIDETAREALRALQAVRA